MKRAKGLSLIELLIAMTIGLFILGGVFAIYLETQSTRRTADVLARMQEDGRYAVMLIADEIRRAGYWGKTTYEATLEGQNGNNPLAITISNDCAASPSWALNLAKEIEAFDNNNPYGATCLDASAYLADTDILVIRSTSPRNWLEAEISDAGIGGPGKIFIRTDVNHGALFEGGGAVPDAAQYTDFEDHRYNASLFYVRPYESATSSGTPADDLPVLRRLFLDDDGADPHVQNEGAPIARGVEDFQVQIGIADGSRIRYVDPEATDIAADMSNVVAVRFWLLLRAEREELGYTNNTIYRYADKNRTFNDGYRRLLLNQTVQTRNLAEIS